MKRNTMTTIPAMLAALALWLLLLAGCGGSQEQGSSQEASASPVSGEFVGEAPDANAFLALVAEKPAEGEQTREVRAYLCDGQGISEWFVGQTSGNAFELYSEGGARLAAKLSGEGASGTFTLSNGEEASFEARPPKGIGGFYPVTVTPEGLVSGTSWAGARLEGRVSGEEVVSAIAPPEGEAVHFEITVPGIERGEYRWIVLPDGQIKGAKQGQRAGFMEKGIDL